LETDPERGAFIEAFWRKRDFSPTTPENEYRAQHYERLAYANEFFGRDTFRDGWMTDRGRFHILLGEPAERTSFDGYDESYPTELWFYNDPELKRLGLPPYFYLLFFRRQGTGELELYSPAIDGPSALLAGYQVPSNDFRAEVERAYRELYRVSPELAHASLSFRTDEGDIAQFSAPSFGTIALLDGIAKAPFRGLDTSYAERYDFERGSVESDYLFSYVPSWGMAKLLPGPRDSYYLHWVIEIDAKNISLVKDEDKGVYQTVFVVSIEVMDRHHPDRRLLQVSKESFVSFTEAEAEAGTRMPFAYSGMVPLASGARDVRIILRNRACTGRDESGCRRSYTLFDASVDVPVWETAQPALSELIVAYGTERPPGEGAYRPFRFGSLQLLPNPRGAYANGDSLVTMTEVLNGPPGSQLKFRIIERDAGRVQLEKSVAVDAFRLEPVVQELLLADFAGGRYQLAVDLLDTLGEVLASRTSFFEVSPRTALPRPAVRVSWPLVFPEIPGLVETALGEQYLVLDEKERARELFEAAVAANSNMGAARESLASLLMEEGDAPRVIDLLEPAFQQVPDRYEIAVLLGEAYFERADYPKASAVLEKALTLRRPGARLLNFLAISQNHLGNRERARELLEQSLSLQPDQPQMKKLLEELRW
jgi:GWxTD domain-containing protein